MKSTDVEQNRIVDALGQESAKVRILIAPNEGDRGAGAVGVAQHPGCGFWVYRWGKTAITELRFLGSPFYRLEEPEPETGVLCVPQRLRQGALAGHDADIFAGAPGGERFAPGESFTVAEEGHAVDGVDKRAVVAQQNMTNGLLIKGG